MNIKFTVDASSVYLKERKMQKSNRNIKVTGVYPRKSPLYKWSDADDNIEPMSEDAVKLATAIDDHREYCFMVKQVIASMIERAEVELSKEAASFFTSDGFFEQLRLHVGNCSDSFQYENEYALFDFVDNLEAMVNDKRSNPNRLPAD